MKEKMNLTEYNKGYPIFTGCFLVDPVLVGETLQWKLSNFYIAYDFNPGDPRFPDNVIEGDFAKIKHIGVYQDKDIVTSRVHLTTMNGNLLTVEHNNEAPLHITWKSGKSAPKESGHRLTKLYNEYIVDDGKDNIHLVKEECGDDWKRYNTMWKMIKHEYDMPDDEESHDENDIIVYKIFEQLEPIGLWHTMRQIDNPDGIEVSLEEE